MSSADLRGSLRAALQFQPTYRDRKKTSQLPTPYLDRISVTEHKGNSTATSSSVANRRRPRASDDWKALMIQPIGVPDLSHTKIATSFAPKTTPFTTPDGRILKGLRTTLQRGFIDAVKSAKADMANTNPDEQQPNGYGDDSGEVDSMYGDEDDGRRNNSVSLFDRSKMTFDELQDAAEDDYEDALVDGVVDERSQYEAGEGRQSSGDMAESKRRRRRKGKTRRTSGQPGNRASKEYSAPPKFECFLDFVYGPSNLTGEYSRAHEAQMREYLPVARR